MKKTLLVWVALIWVACSPVIAQTYAPGDIISYEYKGRQTVDQLKSNVKTKLNGMYGSVLADLFYGWATAFYVKPTYDIELYKVIYQTANQNGVPVAASGLVIVPVNAYRLPITAYCHGTVFRKQDVPSNLCGAGDCFEVNIPYLMASDGHIIAAPDYVGMGQSTQFHPYVESVSESNATIDLMRATKKMVTIAKKGTAWDGTNYLTGYSQGGHAAVATLKTMFARNLWNEFNVRFVGAGGTPADLSNTQFDFIVNNPFYPTRQYILYVLATAKLTEPNNFPDISQTLKPEFVPLYNQHILGQTGELSWVPADWTTMFLPGVIDQWKAANSPLRAFLRKSNCYDFYNNVPTRFYATSEDEQVYNASSTLAERTMRSKLPWWNQLIIKADIFSTVAGNTHEIGGIFSFLYWTERIRNYRNGWGTNLRVSAEEQMASLAAEGDISYHKIAESFLELKSPQAIRSVKFMTPTDGFAGTVEAQHVNGKYFVPTSQLGSGIYKAALLLADGSTREIPVMVENASAAAMPALTETGRAFVLPADKLGDRVTALTVFNTKGQVLLHQAVNSPQDMKIAASVIPASGDYSVELTNGGLKNLYQVTLQKTTQNLRPEPSPLVEDGGSYAVNGVYPMPATAASSVAIEAARSQRITLEHVDFSGRVLSSREVSIQAGKNVIALPFLKKTLTTSYLVVRDEKQAETKRIVLE